MPVDSKYTDKVLKFMRREKRPVTAGEIAEATGMSRQNAYYWLRGEGAGLVTPVGVGRHSATAYVITEEADEYAPRFRPQGIWTVTLPRGTARAKKPIFQLGETFTVISMKIEDDNHLVELQGSNGATFTLNIGPDDEARRPRPGTREPANT